VILRLQPLAEFLQLAEIHPLQALLVVQVPVAVLPVLLLEMRFFLQKLMFSRIRFRQNERLG